jgi:phytoene synthase
MIAGREAEAEDAPPTVEAWLGYLASTAGALAEAAGFALGGAAAPAERLRGLGTAYGVAGLLRSHGGLLPRPVLAAALPAVLARRDLRHPGEMAARGLGDRLAVLAAAALRRV